MSSVEQQSNQFAYNSQERSSLDSETTHNQGWSSLDSETTHNQEWNLFSPEHKSHNSEADDLRELMQFLSSGNNFEDLANNMPSPEQTEDNYNGFHGKNLAVKQNEHPVASAEFSEDRQTNSEYVDSLVAEPVHEQAVNHEVPENRSVSTAEVATNSLLAQIEAYGKGIGEFRNGVVEQNRKR